MGLANELGPNIGLKYHNEGEVGFTIKKNHSIRKEKRSIVYQYSQSNIDEGGIANQLPYLELEEQFINSI